jgi:hypothetical protein
MTEKQAALPVSDFDQLGARSLEARVASLDLQQLEQLIGYERNHAHRAEVLEVLVQRRRRLHDNFEPMTSAPAVF